MPLKESDRPSGAFARYTPLFSRKRAVSTAPSRSADLKGWTRTIRNERTATPGATGLDKGAAGVATAAEAEEEFEEILVPVDEDGNEVSKRPTEILVKNLDASVTSKDVCLGLFGAFDTERVVLHEDKQGRSLGVAEVTFGSREEAETAIRRHNGQLYNGKRIRLVLLASKLAPRVSSKQPEQAESRSGVAVEDAKASSAEKQKTDPADNANGAVSSAPANAAQTQGDSGSAGNDVDNKVVFHVTNKFDIVMPGGETPAGRVQIGNVKRAAGTTKKALKIQKGGKTIIVTQRGQAARTAKKRQGVQLKGGSRKQIKVTVKKR